MIFWSWIPVARIRPAHMLKSMAPVFSPGPLTILSTSVILGWMREDLSLEKIATLSEPYLHYNLSHGLAHWLRRHIVYAEAEAVQLLAEREGKAPYILGLIASNSTIRRRALKQFVNRLPIILRSPLRFIHSYFIRRGFLDGRVGLQYALMLACYETMIVSYVLDKKIKPLAYLN